MKWLSEQIRKVLQLTPREGLILLQAWILLLVLDLALRVMPFHALLTVSQRAFMKSQKQAVRGPSAARLAWLVDVAGRYSPVTATCLKQALVLSWLLGRAGILTTLRIGVARQDGFLRAHAWLEREGTAVFDPGGREHYAPLPPVCFRRPATP